MYHIIANPVAGKKKGYKAIEKLETYLKAENIPYDIVITEDTGHASDLTQEICENYIDEDKINIIAVGGDGTFNEVINGIIDFEKVNLGLIPAGSGNDFARYAGLSKDPIQAFEDIKLAHIRKVDLMELNGEQLGLNVIGTGLDIEVLRKHHKAKIFKGKIGYLMSLVSCLVSFKPYVIKVRYDDGEVSNHECIMVGVCNGSSIGGGMKLSPNSNILDGKLNLIFAHTVKWWKMPWELPKFLSGKYLTRYYGEEHLIKAAEVELVIPEDGIVKGRNKKSRTELYINNDGQIVEGVPFKVKILPAMLNLYCTEEFIKGNGIISYNTYLNKASEK